MKKFFAILFLSAAFVISGCVNQQTIVDFIGTDDAKQMVLEATGVDISEAKVISIDLKEKNGSEYYQVVLETPDGKYRFDVDAITGRIIDKKEIKEEVKTEKEAEKTDKQNKSNDDKPENKLNDKTENKLNDKTENKAPAVSKNEVSSQGNREMISSGEAKKIALNHAGLSENDITFVKNGLDRDDGRQVYDIEFYDRNHNEYDYEIDPYNGAIVDFDYDAEYYSKPEVKSDSARPDNNKDIISSGYAKKIALEHADLSEDEVKFVRRELDQDNGRYIYEVEFYTDNKEYDYEIDAVTGKILDYDYDGEYIKTESSEKQKKEKKDKEKNNSNKAISAGEAKKKALAQVPGAKMSDIVEFETDRDDGRIEYEGKIYYDHMEYEFEIDGYSGAIRNWEVESIHDD